MAESSCRSNGYRDKLKRDFATASISSVVVNVTVRGYTQYNALLVESSGFISQYKPEATIPRTPR